MHVADVKNRKPKQKNKRNKDAKSAPTRRRTILSTFTHSANKHPFLDMINFLLANLALFGYTLHTKGKGQLQVITEAWEKITSSILDQVAHLNINNYA